MAYKEHARFIPGGVTHSSRYFKPYPFVSASAKGSTLTDIDGNTYVDYWCGHGSLIFGHSYSPIADAVKRQVDTTSIFGTVNELELALAQQIVKMVPNVDMVRFPNTGTEAALYAVRLARGASGRWKIGKFEGGWHGGYDAMHIGVKPPFDKIPLGITPDSQKDTVVLPYNDLEGSAQIIKKEKLAGVFVEPVLGAAGAVPAEVEFLKGLREVCDETGALLMFDEVITGFRLAPGGAQEHFGVGADIVTFGKIVGGGYPCGAVAGRREIMEKMDLLVQEPDKLVYQGGTFCGNPITLTGGLTTLRLLEDRRIYDHINAACGKMVKECEESFERYKVPVQLLHAGSIFGAHFTSNPVKTSRDVFAADREMLEKYHVFMIAQGSFMLPTHMSFISYVHTSDQLQSLIEANEEFSKHYKEIV